MLWSACPVWLFAVVCVCKDLQLLRWEFWCFHSLKRWKLCGPWLQSLVEA